MQMNVCIDPHGDLYFNDLLYAFIRRVYTKFIKCKPQSIAHTIIRKAEEHTQRRLYLKRKKQFITTLNKTNNQRNTRIKKDVIRQMIEDTVVNKKNSVNPLSSLFENQIIFRAWVKYS